MARQILIVEDYARFRAFILSVVQSNGEGHLVHEASDGSQAVRYAYEHKPDLVLLDIGLPELNGLEAARQIRKISPDSKIIFLTQESSPELVQEAFSIGARGYVVKSDAEDELLVAVDAVLHGKQFVSRQLRFHLTDRVEEGSSTNIGLRYSEGQTPWREADHFHEMGCYRDDAAFVDDFIRFIEAALNLGKVVILVATEPHRKDIFSGLQSRGWDMVAAMREGTFVSQDPYETLSSFLVEDWPDAGRLRIVGDKLIEKAIKARKAAKVVICGECAPLLWAQGKTEAAVEIERLWDELVVRRHGIDLLCGYVTSDFPGEASNPEFKRICDEHSAVYSL